MKNLERDLCFGRHAVQGSGQGMNPSPPQSRFRHPPSTILTSIYMVVITPTHLISTFPPPSLQRWTQPRTDCWKLHGRPTPCSFPPTLGTGDKTGLLVDAGKLEYRLLLALGGYSLGHIKRPSSVYPPMSQRGMLLEFPLSRNASFEQGSRLNAPS